MEEDCIALEQKERMVRSETDEEGRVGRKNGPD